MMLGSKTFCTEFVNATSSSVEGKRTLYQIIGDPDNVLQPEDIQLTESQQDFIDQVRFIYNYVVSSISTNVIDDIINQALPDTADSDRSDILVFLVILSIFFGDSRYVINNWANILDVDRATVESLKDIAPLASYNWLDIYNASDELNEKQRKALKVSAEIMRYKGTFDGFVACIQNNTFGISSDVDLGFIKIREDYSAQIGSRVLMIESPYTQFSVTGYHYSGLDLYTRSLLYKLEELRPAGVFIYFVLKFKDLEELSYWYHDYKSGPGDSGFVPGLYPADSLRSPGQYFSEYVWTSIAKLIRVEVNGVLMKYTDVYKTFKELPISTNIVSTLYLRNNAFRNPSYSYPEDYLNGDAIIGYYPTGSNIAYDMFLSASCDFHSDGRTTNEYLPVDYEKVGDPTDTGTVSSYDVIS